MSQSDELTRNFVNDVLPSVGETSVEQIRLQEGIAGDGFTDIEIQANEGEVHLVIEAKRGYSLPRSSSWLVANRRPSTRFQPLASGREGAGLGRCGRGHVCDLQVFRVRAPRRDRTGNLLITNSPERFDRHRKRPSFPGNSSSHPPGRESAICADMRRFVGDLGTSGEECPHESRWLETGDCYAASASSDELCRKSITPAKAS